MSDQSKHVRYPSCFSECLTCKISKHPVFFFLLYKNMATVFIILDENNSTALQKHSRTNIVLNYNV